MKLAAIAVSALLLMGTWVFGAGQVLQRIEQVEEQQQRGDERQRQFEQDVKNQLTMLSDGQAETNRKLDVLLAEQGILHGRPR